jgi:16S rRNA (cytidine1402-2'-O)-methyltransferase
MAMSGTLSIVATPIGNLRDITLRALETLKSSDLIACEDTRVTSKLLAAYEISKPLRSLHEHTTSSNLTRVVDELRQGKRVSYVSDAGTPGVNDPGGKLVAAAMEAGIRVEPIPGPSALTTAISVCGFPMDEFTYLGFVPHKKGRQMFFQGISASKHPSVFFESTHRIEKTLHALTEALDPKRLIFVGRELTKIHETVYRGIAADVAKYIEATSRKGEFVIIVGPQRKP